MASVSEVTSHDVAVLFFTNRRLTTNGELSAAVAELLEACPQLVLVTRRDLPQYLTPSLAHRGLLAL
jgi:hypothetical protein